MGLSDDEIAAILRLRDDLERTIVANQGPIIAALKAASGGTLMWSPIVRAEIPLQSCPGRSHS